MPIYGKIGDPFGRKPVFQFAIVVFLAGSAGSTPAGHRSHQPRNRPQVAAMPSAHGCPGGCLASPAGITRQPDELDISTIRVSRYEIVNTTRS
jgi:hypothetical protein